jgi:hypothetical protein
VSTSTHTRLGTGLECRAEGDEQVVEEGKHDRVVHDAIGSMPSLAIAEFTDGKSASRMTSWRTTPDGHLARDSRPMGDAASPRGKHVLERGSH